MQFVDDPAGASNSLLGHEHGVSSLQSGVGPHTDSPLPVSGGGRAARRGQDLTEMVERDQRLLEVFADLLNRVTVGRDGG
ncbi:hypothetical protein GCM10009606_08650 [Nocardioides aquiterrae]|uniref:Uncharacterized protein n=1 Tax=Nocardioides aquiterrae TaxID=203799 RepID=A0ABP4EXI1_9ACTN